MANAKAEKALREEATQGTTEEQTNAEEVEAVANSTLSTTNATVGRGRTFTNAWGTVISFVRTSSDPPSKSSASSDPSQPEAISKTPEEEASAPSADKAEPIVRTPVEMPLPPWSVDLRPYGMGIVLDFGWERAR